VSSRCLYVLVDHVVYRSNDAGASWGELLGRDPERFSFEALSGAPTACGGAVYASAEGQRGLSVRRLDDAGGLVEQRLSGSGTVLDLGEDRLLFVSAFDLRQRSDDGGQSWWTAGISLELADVASSPARAGLVFAATGSSTYRSDDGGGSWQIGAQYPGRFMGDLYPNPHDAEVVYARSQSGESSPWSFVSTDGGATFHDWPVPTAAAPEIPLAFAASPTGSVTVATYGGVYTTSDAGRHFSTLLTSTLGIATAAIGGGEPPAVFAAIYGPNNTHELRASSDGGTTWTSTDPGTGVWCLVAHPTDPNVAFACVGINGSDDAGLMRTLDGGGSWSRIPAPGGESPLILRVDPSPPHAVYALTETLSPMRSSQALYRSDDQGDTWQQLAEPPPLTYSFDIAAQPDGKRRVLGQTGAQYELFE